jgi:hypothetical protein
MTSLETYIKELRETRHAAVNETSYYGALANLINDIGNTLKPKVRYVITPKSLGAGLPDGGLYTAQQFQRGAEASLLSTPPERGCVEVKGLGEDVLKIALSAQVEKYLKRYRQALVTNYRDFLLVALDENGKAVNLERYTLAQSEAEFWTAAAHTQAMAKEHDDRFTEYLKRVMLHAAPLSSPEDVARFLASYARDAKARVEQKKDLPALNSLRSALEEALGLKFEGKDGEHFFRSTLVQTLFYGIFSAWVLWSRQHPKREASEQARFDWRSAAWSLRVPMIRALFEQILMPSKLEQLGLVEVLDWAAMTLNRVEDPAAFIEKFTEGHAVQYFYEPFLQEFDPELRKQLGVWYTPTEIVKYMVARVDTVLREELNLPEGLASENVYVLDPCCGTGAYLVEVLRHIEGTLKERGEDATIGAELKRAAMNRVFGFEILPAPFVVAHLQLGLLLQTLDAPLSDDGDERVGVYLTNALTGWEPPKEPKTHLLFPELEEERDRAEEVKRDKPILVILGNPPYNAFAGTSPAEEQGLIEPYKEGLVKKWGIKKFNLDDLYVRFFRLAERRIGQKHGVVCYISNYSYLSDPSFVVMRERFLEEFDALWFDSMNGDSRRTGKLTPEGEPDPSAFSTEYNKEGIRVGTAIGLMVRKKKREAQPTVRYRQFWGITKRADLLASLKTVKFNAQYQITNPEESNWLTFQTSNASFDYLSWPSVAEIGGQSPYRAFIEARRGALIDIDRATLEKRFQRYFDAGIDWNTLKELEFELTEDAARFDAKKARAKIVAAESYDEDNIRRYAIRPFENRWSYHSSVRPLWNEPRPELWAQCWSGNRFFVTRLKTEKEAKGSPFYFASSLVDYQAIARNVSVFPLRLLERTKKKSSPQNHFFADAETNNAPIANLSTAARAYLASLGVEDVDTDAETAALIWMHALAIGYAPAYLAENADGIRNDWPRIPLPNTTDALNASAELGRTIAAILAYDAADPASKQSATRPPLNGIVGTKPRPELRVTGAISRTGGGQLKPDAPHHELRVTAGWGHAGKGGVTMPGKGKVVTRPYTDDERAAIEEGATSLGLTPGEAFASLGETTLDVYLNDTAYWRNIPARVWDYHIGGYQVIKKWLSYREHELLGRDLTIAEAAEVRDMARRITALRLLESALDANYRAIKEAVYEWQKD